MSKKIKNIHFVGIKGVGVTPLAIIAKQAGFKVTGCDIEDEFITDVPLKDAGIVPQLEFSTDHISDVDLVITTGAHGGYDNAEVAFAKKSNIPVWSQGEAVGKFMNGDIFNRKFEGISVAGSHGKTTTTAMIATILKENKFDPTFAIGTGEIPSLGSSGHYGEGKYFVAEADEYATEPVHDKTPKFLWQKPKIGIITNIEFDHPDIYNSVEQLHEVFLKFAENISDTGILIVCKDDIEALKVVKKYSGKLVTYGFSKDADYYIEKISIGIEKMFFWVNAGNTSLGEFSLNVTGEHNALNALCAIVTCLDLGLSVENIKKGLPAFLGTKRRLEYKGVLRSGAVLYDDYAHHPTEIKKTLIALDKTYPKTKIVCIFQPHTYLRTEKMFEQFVSSFSNADQVIITDIYPSLREEPNHNITSKMLSESIKKIHRDTYYIAKLDDVIEYVDKKQYDKQYLLVTMGAGDVYKIAEKILKNG